MRFLCCLLVLITGAPSVTWADCRARVVVKQQVVVQAAVVAVAVPVYTVGYVPACAPAAVMPASQGDLQKRLAQLEAEIARLKGGQVQATGVLPFLSAANRCGACHAGGVAKGQLDLSNGLGGLSADQLTRLLTRTYDHDGPNPMPPREAQTKNAPLTDQEYGQLVGAVNQVVAAKR